MRRPRNLVGAPAARALEAELRRALAPMVAQARAAASRVRTVGEARALGVALRARWPDSRIRAIVAAVGRKAEASAVRPWGPVVRASIRARARRDAAEYDGAKLVDEWSRKAASLITSVRDEVAEGLRRDVVAALESGTDPATLAARWRAQGVPVEWGTLEGRMKVIAQHQLSTLHAGVQRERATALGVSEFVWRSQGDDKVRDEHRAADGQIYTYADGHPTEGLPGEPVNCRCWAESVIPDALAEELGISKIFER